MEQNLRPTTAGGLADKVNASIELVAANILERIGEARAELDNLEAQVLNTCHEAKSKVVGVVETSEVVLNAVSSLRVTLEHLRANAAKPMGLVTQITNQENGHAD